MAVNMASSESEIYGFITTHEIDRLLEAAQNDEDINTFPKITPIVAPDPVSNNAVDLPPKKIQSQNLPPPKAQPQPKAPPKAQSNPTHPTRRDRHAQIDRHTNGQSSNPTMNVQNHVQQRYIPESRTAKEMDIVGGIMDTPSFSSDLHPLPHSYGYGTATPPIPTSLHCHTNTETNQYPSNPTHTHTRHLSGISKAIATHTTTQPNTTATGELDNHVYAHRYDPFIGPSPHPPTQITPIPPHNTFYAAPAPAPAPARDPASDPPLNASINASHSAPAPVLDQMHPEMHQQMHHLEMHPDGAGIAVVGSKHQITAVTRANMNAGGVALDINAIGGPKSMEYHDSLFNDKTAQKSMNVVTIDVGSGDDKAIVRNEMVDSDTHNVATYHWRNVGIMCDRLPYLYSFLVMVFMCVVLGSIALLNCFNESGAMYAWFVVIYFVGAIWFITLSVVSLKRNIFKVTHYIANMEIYLWLFILFIIGDFVLAIHFNLIWLVAIDIIAEIFAIIFQWEYYRLERINRTDAHCCCLAKHYIPCA